MQDDSVEHLAMSSRILTDRDWGLLVFLASPNEKTALMHPASDAISYLGRNDEPFRRFLYSITDYRWFTDPARPDRISRLEKFSGLVQPRKIEGCGHTLLADFSHGMPIGVKDDSYYWSGFMANPYITGYFKLLRKIMQFVILHWRGIDRSEPFDPHRFFHPDKSYATEYLGKLR
jgi:hypothetical protein